MTRPAIFTEEQVREIRLSLLSDRVLAKELSVSYSVINTVRTAYGWYAKYPLSPDEIEAANTRKHKWLFRKKETETP